MKRNTKKIKYFFIEDIQEAYSKISSADEAITFLNGIFQECYSRNMDELRKTSKIANDIEMDLRNRYNIAEERDNIPFIIAGAKERFFVKA